MNLKKAPPCVKIVPKLLLNVIVNAFAKRVATGIETYPKCSIILLKKKSTLIDFIF